MVLLTTSTMLAITLGLLNLLLTYGVIRRLRLAHAPVTAPPALLAGGEAGDFEATTTRGELISAARLHGETTVGFFTPGCAPCEENLPAFVASARRGVGKALAVIVADYGDEAASMVSCAENAADVVIEQPGGPVCRAFGVTGTPLVITLHDRRITRAESPVKVA